MHRLAAAVEKRWTLFSSCWYLVMELKYFGTPPALRYLLFLAWRGVLSRLYEAHKALVLWREWRLAAWQQYIVWGCWRTADGATAFT